MADLSEINPHLALAASESYVSPKERAWERWVKAVEKLVGLDLGYGDQTQDGFSIDFANDYFEDGWSPNGYVQAVIEADATSEGLRKLCEALSVRVDGFRRSDAEMRSALLTKLRPA